MASRWVSAGQDGATCWMMASKSLRMAQDDTQEAYKMAQEASRMASDASKTPPDEPQEVKNH